MGRPALADALGVLERGEIEVLGLLLYSSNYTFLARVGWAGDDMLAVYKPRRGERPLWDFPHGSLAAREVAAFLVSEAAGWGIVPPTVLRADAPLGEGSLQLFIEHDPQRHYFVLMEERALELTTFAAFDAVINNADRKSGHVLEDPAGKLWAVDHGVSFHVEPKLRTVIWAFAGEQIGDGLCGDLERLDSALGDETPVAGTLEGFLTNAEAGALRSRTKALLTDGRFPEPAGDRPLPWPLV